MVLPPYIIEFLAQLPEDFTGQIYVEVYRGSVTGVGHTKRYKPSDLPGTRPASVSRAS